MKPRCTGSSFTVELEGPTRAKRSFAADGKFSFGRVDPGDYTVSVTSSAGNGPRRSKWNRASPPTSRSIALASNAIVIGKLVDRCRQAAGGLPVAVIPDANDGSLRVEL